MYRAIRSSVAQIGEATKTWRRDPGNLSFSVLEESGKTIGMISTTSSWRKVIGVARFSRTRFKRTLWQPSRAIVWLLLGMLGSGLLLVQGSSHPVRVSADGRYLERADGKPFFYLGDTAWELFHRLSREEAVRYLQDRAEKGFTVIQGVVLAELAGLTEPNANGELPLVENDPERPSEAYFSHVDFVVSKAEELGLTIGMLPTWGDKWNKKWGIGPEIFTPENAEKFGEFLGERYQARSVIWILGGDRSPENEKHLAIIRAMAKGLAKGDAGAHLMTYHPMGGNNSAQWFHQDEWLDFNMFQSGHGAYDIPNYKTTRANYLRQPAKPTLDGEPRYEDHPVNWKPELGWFEAFDVRQAAYWSLLAGACGHTYGNHNIWQFWEPGRRPISSARTAWQTALNHPGAFQMGHMRRLFEARPFHTLRPDPEFVIAPESDGPDHVEAARAEDGSFAFVYTPYGRAVTVDLDRLTGENIKVFWFDPRLGIALDMGRVKKEGHRAFSPFSSGRGEDWVLILDDAAKGYRKPGDKRK